jgi:hypothetical protein
MKPSGTSLDQAGFPRPPYRSRWLAVKGHPSELIAWCDKNITPEVFEQEMLHESPRKHSLLGDVMSVSDSAVFRVVPRRYVREHFKAIRHFISSRRRAHWDRYVALLTKVGA